jgi:hypothetical protein
MDSCDGEQQPHDPAAEQRGRERPVAGSPQPLDRAGGDERGRGDHQRCAERRQARFEAEVGARPHAERLVRRQRVGEIAEALRWLVRIVRGLEADEPRHLGRDQQSNGDRPRQGRLPASAVQRRRDRPANAPQIASVTRAHSKPGQLMTYAVAALTTASGSAARAAARGLRCAAATAGPRSTANASTSAAWIVSLNASARSRRPSGT